MIYLEIDTDKEGYPLKEVSGGCDNHFDAGSEFINQTKKFFPGILDCKSILSELIITLIKDYAFNICQIHNNAA